ncbi:MAG: tRNA (adenosine(37)-N6)-threonylcarbamoyltransferase complex transferase subunit TsaD, partial [Sulfurovum sp.]
LRNSKLIAFSLSGLKNAVRLEIERLGGAEAMSEQDKCDLAASFQKAVKLHLLQKSKKIFKTEPVKDFAIVGGASANNYIRNAYETLCQEFGKTLHVAPLEYCSDNAAMIGRYALDAYKKGQFTTPDEVDLVVTKKQQQGALL